MKLFSVADDKRRERYKEFEQIFYGTNDEMQKEFLHFLMREKQTNQVAYSYIALNFGTLLSQMSASFLFGEDMRYYIDGDEDDRQREFINDFVKENKLNVRNYEAALESSFLGDTIMKLRRADDGTVKLDYIHPKHVHVDTAQDDASTIEKITISMQREIENSLYTNLEIHTVGQIEHQVWLTGKNNELLGQVDLFIWYGDNAPQEIEETGVDDLLVKIIPNWKPASRIWGLSDYTHIDAILYEMNNRVTRFASALNKHADPKMAVPPGVLTRDDKGLIKASSFDMVEVDATGGQIAKPEYIQSSLDIDGIIKYMEFMTKKLMQLTETSSVLVDDGDAGFASSGTALALRLIPTTKKMNRKKLYFEDALEWAFNIAQKLGGYVDPVDVNVELQDGIPDDPVERANIEKTLQEAGLSSKLRGIQLVRGIDEEEALAEYEKIREEKNDSMPPIFSSSFMTNKDQDDNSTDEQGEGTEDDTVSDNSTRA